MNEQAPSQSSFEEERFEREVDKLGSVTLAALRLDIMEPSVSDSSSRNERLEAKTKKRRRPIHTRFEGPTESDLFHQMTGDASSRSPEQRAINLRGAALVRQVLAEHHSQKATEAARPTSEEIAIEVETRSAAVNASWDETERAITAREQQ